MIAVANDKSLGFMPSSHHIILALILATLSLSACLSEEELFTQGRLEKYCRSAIPACAVQASCVLGDKDYLSGHFPGGARVIARSQPNDTSIKIRILLTEPLAPGTQLLIQVSSPGCDEITEERLEDIDLFALAGEDRILDLNVPLIGQGDHLVEVFSDMSSTWLMTFELSQEP